jgi:hypothetical protein
MLKERNPSGRPFAAALFLSLLLAACGGSGGSGPAPGHQDTAIDTAGRLAIAEDAAPSLRLHDLDSGSAGPVFTLANPASAVYASPGGRYALAFQRPQDTVQAADGGIWQEDHGDHLHDYKQAPSLLAMRVNGPQPTHYDDRAGQAAVFMDGRSPSGQVSSVVLLSDASIAKGTAVASLTLGTAMHGLAEPNGDHLVVSYRDPASAGTSPTNVEVYRRDGAQYTFVQRLPTVCAGMHGSYTRGGNTAIGCSDGVLLVSGQGAGFTSTLVATASGVGTLAGHPRQERIIGIGNAGTPSTTRFFDVDPAARTATPIAIAGWGEGRLRRAHGFDRSGRWFFALDDLGNLFVLERGTAGWSLRRSLPLALPAMPAAAPFPAFAANGAKDEVYLTDPVARQVVAVGTSQLDIRRIALDYKPAYLAWVGINR